ncbi:MAG: hypothetical protein LQ347_006284 [Umbilicaria vellea]|nr:MAG: hypothetical protein LQ347_006284 [Umbilicaria vellea]
MQNNHKKENNGIVRNLHKGRAQKHSSQSPSLDLSSSRSQPDTAQHPSNQPQHPVLQSSLHPATATMCVGYNRKHRECGHIRDFVIVAACKDAVAYENRCGGPIRTIIFTADIVFPGLCRACYVKEEVWIFELYAGEIADLKKAMASIRNIIRLTVALRDETRRELEAELVHLQEGLDDSLADRQGMLVKFRKSQGVWGDG